MLPLHWEQDFHLLMFCGFDSFLFQNGPGGLTVRHANLVLWFKAALWECCVGSMDVDLASWERCIGSMDDLVRLWFILRSSWVLRG